MAAVIPVREQPEPPAFDTTVRQPGLKWLRGQSYDPDKPLPPKVEPAPKWRACLRDLHNSYSGVCAYVCVYIEKVVGGTSADHFVAKSMTKARDAYEWKNFRLACSTMNSRKGRFDDVLDPFDLAEGTFFLELVSGRIYPNPAREDTERASAAATIRRLRLDDDDCRQLRVRYWQAYIDGYVSEQYLRLRSPFVWYEAKRQGLL